MTGQSTFPTCRTQVRNSRVCRVSFRSDDGLEHSVEVAASSLYEAAALGLKVFRSSNFAEGVVPGKATRLTVTVMQPEACHELRVSDLEEWLGCNGKSPGEQALNIRLRQTQCAGTWGEQRVQSRLSGTDGRRSESVPTIDRAPRSCPGALRLLSFKR